MKSVVINDKVFSVGDVLRYKYNSWKDSCFVFLLLKITKTESGDIRFKTLILYDTHSTTREEPGSVYTFSAEKLRKENCETISTATA